MEDPAVTVSTVYIWICCFCMAQHRLGTHMLVHLCRLKDGPALSMMRGGRAASRKRGYEEQLQTYSSLEEVETGRQEVRGRWRTWCRSIVSCWTLGAKEDAGRESWREVNIQHHICTASVAFRGDSGKLSLDWLPGSDWYMWDLMLTQKHLHTHRYT